MTSNQQRVQVNYPDDLHVPVYLTSGVTMQDAVRIGDWKLYMIAGEVIGLYDLENDPNETTNLVDQYPEIVKRLKALAEEHQRRWWSSSDS